MKILGIDPGVNRIGYGFIEKSGGQSKEKVLCTGTISPSIKEDYNTKLKYIQKEFDNLLECLKPDIVAIEEIYLGKNVQITLKIGQIIGLIVSLSIKREICFALISTREIKQNITGSGAATKEQVRFMLEHITGYKKFDKMDESDAVAVAISYLINKKEDDLLYLR